LFSLRYANPVDTNHTYPKGLSVFSGAALSKCAC
jgi:hypothetical protein